MERPVEKARTLRCGRLDELRRQLTDALGTVDPTDALWRLVSSGELDVVLPELGQLAMAQDPVHRHKDVRAHTITVTAATPPRPATRRISTGGVTFRHHEAVGARIARIRLTDLGYGDELVADVARLVELSGRVHGYERGWADVATRRYARDPGPLLGDLNILVRCDCTRDPRKVAARRRRVDHLERRIRELAVVDAEQRQRPVLDGNQVMAALGIGPGPDVGSALARLLDHARVHGPPSDSAAIDLVRARHRDSSRRP